jgi:ribosome recycling factor
MERKILKTIEHMTHKLADLKSGGTFNTSALEGLQVQPDKQSQELMKLSDLAQVVIQGRQVKVILSDEAVSLDPDLVKSNANSVPVLSTSNQSNQQYKLRISP